MSANTETSKHSSAKPRAAAPPKKSAATGVTAAKSAAPRGAAKARPRRAAAAPVNIPRVEGTQALDHDIRRALIAQTAYFRAERRGFVAGGEEQDWLAAEAEVDAMFAHGKAQAANDG